MKHLDREMTTRVELFNSQNVVEDLKVIQMDTRGIDPVDAAIINVQKARIQALYQPNQKYFSSSQNTGLLLAQPEKDKCHEDTGKK
nr:hypothetical protein [Tanacetum cinerariifolium]